MNAVKANPGGGQASVNGGVFQVLLLFAMAVAGVAWVYTGMVTRDQWPIRWLEIDGSFQRVSGEQLRASIAPLVSGSYFTVNLSAVGLAARSQPWVAEAAVIKQWPDTVAVKVREFEPVAHWTGGRLISTDGRPFLVPGADEIQGLPWLDSPEQALPEAIAAWREFNEMLLPLGLEIDLVRLDARGAWFLRLNNGTEIHLGRDAASRRLQRMVQSWVPLTRGRPVAPAGIDLRYTNGFAVRWTDNEEHNGKES